MEELVKIYNEILHNFIHAVNFDSKKINDLCARVNVNKHDKNDHEKMIDLYTELVEGCKEDVDIVNKTEINFSKYKNINFKEIEKIEKLIFFGVSGEEKIIKEIVKYLSENNKYFEFFTLNGSIGDMTYKPGWSDIDIFLQLSKYSFSSGEALKKGLSIIKRCSNLMYAYNMMQFHGIFISTPLNKYGHINRFFPIPVIKDGINFIHNEKSFPIIDSDKNYYQKDILESYLNLRNKMNTRDKVLLIHRLYSFPFSYLQSKGMSVGKKESFNLIKKREEIKNIRGLIEESVDTYKNFKINKILTWKFRYLLYKYLPLKLCVSGRCMRLNYNIFIKLEPEMKKEVDKIYFKLKKYDKEFLNFIEGDIDDKCK